jgi:predicted XRE-type DNA-binding protein
MGKTLFGQWVETRGLKVPDIARALELSSSYIYMLVRGQCARPSWKVARKIEAWSMEAFGAENGFAVSRWS